MQQKLVTGLLAKLLYAGIPVAWSSIEHGIELVQ